MSDLPTTDIAGNVLPDATALNLNIDVPDETPTLSSPIPIPVENADCDCWKNEGEMLEWANKIKELQNKLREQKEEYVELQRKYDSKNFTIDELKDIIHHLAAALQKFINEEV